MPKVMIFGLLVLTSLAACVCGKQWGDHVGVSHNHGRSELLETYAKENGIKEIDHGQTLGVGNRRVKQGFAPIGYRRVPMTKAAAKAKGFTRRSSQCIQGLGWEYIKDNGEDGDMGNRKDPSLYYYNNAGQFSGLGTLIYAGSSFGGFIGLNDDFPLEEFVARQSGRAVQCRGKDGKHEDDCSDIGLRLNMTYSARKSKCLDAKCHWDDTTRQGWYVPTDDDDVFRIAIGTRNEDPCHARAIDTENPIGTTVIVNPDQGGGYHIPIYLDQLSHEFVQGSCIDTMGYHYYRDVSTSDNTVNWDSVWDIMPVWPMYYEGYLSAIFFSVPDVQQTVSKPRDDWDGIPLNDFLMCRNTCDLKHCNFPDTAAMQTMHIFFQDTKNVKCTKTQADCGTLDSKFGCCSPDLYRKGDEEVIRRVIANADDGCIGIQKRSDCHIHPHCVWGEHYNRCEAISDALRVDLKNRQATHDALRSVFEHNIHFARNAVIDHEGKKQSTDSLTAVDQTLVSPFKSVSENKAVVENKQGSEQESKKGVATDRCHYPIFSKCMRRPGCTWDLHKGGCIPDIGK